ncbi:flagellar hook protein FlgE [Stutzerimonas xanthomarina]|uniref:Flagellar hook protein FlgE n=2 Tax=Stutzerimonas xanthomarina TaxID=271420 RepID=A0A1M5RRR5_9GAMM|nr:flagellar hook protein FlgE [Stutzerimonas xanthomarina]MCP9339272.1 flagellar hook protein FlgE [Stutzerimonas xanthomarina]SEH94524.1 flagellar hook protein FlgE [Stutzerimonas xanthomarina]SHH28946.1 flagellar hook protein FlgE [Stutzerimonas xanthomarina DSM 18231]
MSFNIGLSGMRAASKDLNVTGNNIANAGTAGFKQSRAEFADVYSGTMAVSKNTVGSGVQLASISQQFSQGNINYTQNSLDLAINGSGFFQVSNNGAVSYTRAGYFGVDKNGMMVDNFGNNLQGRTLSPDGTLTDKVGNLVIQTDSQAPKATSEIGQTFNLDSTNVRPANAGRPSAVPPEARVFDPSDPLTYNSSTSTNIFDQQGNSHVLTQYFVRSDNPDQPNEWEMYVLVDGRNHQDPNSEIAPFTTLNFTVDGKLIPGAPQDPAPNPPAPMEFDQSGVLILQGWNPARLNAQGVWETNGAAAEGGLNIDVDLRSATQYASPFAVNSIGQDGYTTGEMVGLEIDESGQIFARYTNGQSKVQGQVVLASFANEQGLIPVGKTQWIQSFQSGEPAINPPGVGTMGTLQAGALEDSNVELSDQLVNLIVAQRNYQANAKTIETESALTQTIINLR